MFKKFLHTLRALFTKRTIPGWIVFLLPWLVKIFDWWQRFEFAKSKMSLVVPYFYSAIDFVRSGTGNLCFMAAGLIWLFWSASRKHQPKTTRPGFEHVSDVVKWYDAGVKLQATAPLKEEKQEAVDAWKEELIKWSNDAHNFLNTCSIRAGIKFADVSGLVTRNFSVVHGDVQGEFNVLDRRISNLTQIIERPSDYLT